MNDYGISERLQRLLALQLAGGCTRTENGKAVRGEINLQLVVDPIVDQTGLLELLSELTPNSTTIRHRLATAIEVYSSLAVTIP